MWSNVVSAISTQRCLQQSARGGSAARREEGGEARIIEQTLKRHRRQIERRKNQSTVGASLRGRIGDRAKLSGELGVAGRAGRAGGQRISGRRSDRRIGPCR